MITDEWERLHEQNQLGESLQSWVQQSQDEARPHHTLLLAPVIRLIGKELISLGSGLTQRFGDPDDRLPHKHSLN